MNVAIVSNWHDPKPAGQVGFDELAATVMPNRRDYARSRGYLCHETNKPGHYGKLWALLEAWKSADWLWWLDIDAIITRPDRGLEGLLSDGDVVLSCDGNGLNSGSMLLRTIPEVRRIISLCLERRRVFDVPPWHEQNALAYLLWNIRERVRIVDKAALNSYPGDWTRESFVLHCPGIPNARRLELLQRHLAGMRVEK